MKRTLCMLLSLVLALTGIVGLGMSAHAAYNVGDTLTFGVYPQSRVTGSSLISTLNGKAAWTSSTYYSGSDYYGSMQEFYAWQYSDVTHGGQKYRGVKIITYRTPTTIGKTGLAADNYTQYKNGYQSNTVYWFRYDPITWRVLDPSTGLVLCDTILDARAFHDLIYKTEDNRTYGDAAKTFYSSNWAKSSIRTWLGGDFMNMAFTTAQQNKILTTHSVNMGVYTLTGQTHYTHLDVADTDDKVFLLSYDEVIRSAYGFSSTPGVDDALRRRAGTEYARSQGLLVSNVNDSFAGNSNWLLRTAGQEPEMVCCVTRSGVSAYIGGTETYRQTVGIRPAMCLADVRGSSTPPAKEIGTLAVTGVPKPVVGMDIQTSGLQASEGFKRSSAAVQAYDGGKWTGSGGTFKGGMRYRLSLMLSPVDGYTYANKITATVNGKTEDGSGNKINVLKAGSLYVLYYYFETLPETEIAIRNYVPERKIDYRTTIVFTAEPTNLPADGRTVWVMTTESGETSYKSGEKLIVNEAKEGFVIYVRAEQKTQDGFEVVAVSPQERVSVKKGFFDKLKAFFRSLFRRLPEITQEYLGMEIYE